MSTLEKTIKERFDELDETAQLIVSKFLKDHNALQTNFKIKDEVHSDVVQIFWMHDQNNFDRDGLWASFYYQKADNFVKTKEKWSMYAQENEDEIYVKQTGNGNIVRHSKDFEDFIKKHFKKTKYLNTQTQKYLEKK